MTRIRWTFSLLALLLAAGAAAQTPPAPVSFFRQIKPILQTRCQGCHQPLSQGGKLLLTGYQSFRAGGQSGPAFRPGHPEDSLVLKMVTGNPPPMPKNQKPLDPAQVALLRRWIAEGAKDDTPAVKDPINAAHPPVYRAAPVITALAFSPDGGTLAVSGFREVLLFRADGSERTARLIGRSPRITALAYSPDGRLLAAVGGAPAQFGEVQFWETATGALKNAVELSYDELYGAAFSPDGKSLSVGGADKAVRIVSVPDGKQTLKFDNHDDWVFATTWATDDKHLISTGRDRAIKLIVAENGSFVDDINTFTSSYRCMARHPKADQVLVAGDDGLPRLYQVFRTHVRTMNQEDYDLLRTYETLGGQVNAVAFSPDGASFAVGGETGEVRLYRTADGQRLATLKDAGQVIYALAYRPDGKTLAVGGFDGQVRLYDTATGALLKAFVPVPLQK